MKQFFLLLFLFSFTTGCNFLSSNKEDSLNKDSLTEEENLDDIFIEEGMDEEEDEEIDEDLDEEEEFEEGEEEGETKKGGFFSWLFNSSDEESEEESDSEFVGEDEDFSSIDREFEDYEEEEEENLTESLSAEDEPEQASEPVSIPEETTTEETTTEETIKNQAVPLNKIMSVPYTKAGQIINAVYIARPNEDLALISQKIYGNDETDQLVKINSHIQNRSVVVGDKIYYNSPNRPNDKNKLLFYYQDNNLAPSYYNLSPGENIRTVAMRLLGHPKSWKEIWATNLSLESKSIAETNMNITYWPQSTEKEAAPVTEPTEPAASKTEPMTQPESPSETKSLPPAPETIMPEETINDTKDQIKKDLNQPIPNIPTHTKTKQSKGIISELLNNIEMIFGVIIFLLLLYLIIHIILKKRKQRDFDYTATNIE